ncbi:MAG: hypothetical protein K2W85_00160 [Phycisphaerales bacterium]|nr:hypothetical protein [Phycisphaerales bacterium]
MKAIWNILAIFAVLNVLAVGGLLGWLGTSNRLNSERINAIRTALARTIEQEKAEAAMKEMEAKQQADEKAKQARLAEPPVTAGEKIAEQQFRDEQRQQMLLRQQQELENLRSSLLAQLAKLEEREKKLETDRKAFEAERTRLAAMDQDKQFKLALSTLENQKPKDAKLMMSALLERQEHEQVVAYLAVMEEGKRGKVLAEFVKDDSQVAADLLERLRRRGLAAPVAPPVPAAEASPTNAQRPANAAAPAQSPPAGSTSR